MNVCMFDYFLYFFLYTKKKIVIGGGVDEKQTYNIPRVRACITQNS